MLGELVILMFALLAAGLFVVARWPVQVLRLLLACKARRRGLTGVRIQVDGTCWPAFASGSFDGRTVAVILHGFGVDRYSMLSIASALCSDGHPVLLPDLPGFGDHAYDPQQPHDEAFMLDRLDALVQAVGADRIVLIGSSMGGGLSAAWAHRDPDRVVGLVLLDPAGVEPPIENEIYAAATDETNPLEIRTIADFDRILDLNFVRPPHVAWIIKQGLVRRARASADQHALIIRDLEPLLRDGMRGRLQAIRQPVLLIWGRMDRIIDPSVVPLWQAGLPTVEVLWMDDCGHVPWMDCPMETKAAICRFMGNEWA